MKRLLARLFSILSILSMLLSCGPPKDAPPPNAATLAKTSEEVQTQKDLIGTWNVRVNGKDQGILTIEDDKRFVMRQKDPTNPKIEVKLTGAYYVDGQQVIRFIEKAEVSGGPAARQAEIRQRAAEAIEKPQLATLEWASRDKFIFRDEDGREAIYTRTAQREHNKGTERP